MRRIFLLLTVTLTAALALTSAATAKDLTVMSRNIYLGADLLPLAVYGPDPANEPAFSVAAGGVWSVVQATNYPLRARGLAAELKKYKPDVVGLQEAAVWRRSKTATGEPTTVSYDFIKTLLAEAKKRGVHYRLVVAQDEFDFTAPTNLGYKIRFTQRDALLVRKGAPIRVQATSKKQYSESFKVETPVGVADSKRGWVALDAKYGSRNLRIINTHLEAYGNDIRTSQAKELTAGPVNTSRRLIVFGDLNSPSNDAGPAGDAYRTLTAAGLDSVFKSPVATCCQDERLDNPTSKLSEPIDQVMLRPKDKFTVRKTFLTGNRASDRISGLWPSDHAGVGARVKVK